MAMATGVYGPFLTALGTGTNFQLNASDDVKIALLSDTHTPNFDTDDQYADLDNEVTGTGWASAQSLGSPTWAIDTGNNRVELDGTDVSASNTTLSSIEGCAFYDDTLAGDPLLCAHDFGSTYNTSTGTLSITFAASGIMYIGY